MATATTRSGPGIREIRRQELIDSLTRTARELFMERGYEQTTLEEICGRVGISLRTFFRHFDGKASLLASVTGGLEDRVSQRVAEAPAGLSFVDAFESAFDLALGEYLHNDPEFARRQVGFLLMAPAQLTAHWVESPDSVDDPMEVQVAQRLGLQLRDPRVRLFRGFVSMLVLEAVSRWSDNPAAAPLPELARENLKLARVLEADITRD